MIWYDIWNIWNEIENFQIHLNTGAEGIEKGIET